MNVLMYLQLSRNKDGKYVMSADSNFNFMSKVCNMFAERKDNVDIIIPSSIQRVDIKNDIISQVPHSNLLEVTYADDVFGSRFFFNQDMVDIVRDKKYDLLWINDPSLVQNFKIFANGKPKIITYNHWVDFPTDKKSPDGFTYMYRQFEASMISDVYLLNSDFHVEEFQKQFRKVFKQHSKSQIISFPPIANASVGRDLSDRIKILFNHRLSSLPQYKENFDNFVSVINRNREVDVIITNPEGKTPKFQIPRHFEVVNSVTEEEYNYLLKSCNTQLNCFDYAGGWSMSASDAIVNSYNTLLLSHSGYREMTPLNSYSQCSNLSDMRMKLDKLIRDPYTFEKGNKRNLSFLQDNYSYNASKLRLEAILNEI